MTARSVLPGSSSQICIGQFAAPHGVRGALRLHSYTANPTDILRYDPIRDGQGVSYAVRLLHGKGDMLVVKVEGVDTREAAERLRGVSLFIAKEVLPETAADEFYEADLIGCCAVSPTGEVLGEITACHHFGAGPLIELRLDKTGEELMLPFAAPFVSAVDMRARRITVVMPDDMDKAPEGSPEEQF